MVSKKVLYIAFCSLIVFYPMLYDFKRNMFRLFGIGLYGSDCGVFGRCLSFSSVQEAEKINSKMRGFSLDDSLWDSRNKVYTLYSKRYQNANYSGYTPGNSLSDRSILLNEHGIVKIGGELYTFLYEEGWRKKLDCMCSSSRSNYKKEMGKE